MPQLLDLQGRPLTWVELHERNRRWWQTQRDVDWAAGLRAVMCGQCMVGQHQQCIRRSSCWCRSRKHRLLRPSSVRGGA